jgi:hypothetical protein
MELSMFYVLYSPVKRSYRDELGYLVQFDKAERFSKPDEKTLFAVQQEGGKDFRWVGPCEEGKEP